MKQALGAKISLEGIPLQDLLRQKRQALVEGERLLRAFRQHFGGFLRLP
jgi:hypothetical protein